MSKPAGVNGDKGEGEGGGKTSVQFAWGEKKREAVGKKKGVEFYESFTYDGVEYSLYDHAFLFKSGADVPYVGKIVRMWEAPPRKRRLKLHWLFRPSEIKPFLHHHSFQPNELFLASGNATGASNVNEIEAIGGKCNVVCTSKDERNPQPSHEDLEVADFVFHRAFNVETFKICPEIEGAIPGVEAKFIFNRKEDKSPAEKADSSRIDRFGKIDGGGLNASAPQNKGKSQNVLVNSRPDVCDDRPTKKAKLEVNEQDEMESNSIPDGEKVTEVAKIMSDEKIKIETDKNSIELDQKETKLSDWSTEKPAPDSNADIDSKECFDITEEDRMPKTLQRHVSESSKSNFLCKACQKPHPGICTRLCYNCHQPGHLWRDCKFPKHVLKSCAAEALDDSAPQIKGKSQPVLLEAGLGICNYRPTKKAKLEANKLVKIKQESIRNNEKANALDNRIFADEFITQSNKDSVEVDRKASRNLMLEEKPTEHSNLSPKMLIPASNASEFSVDVDKRDSTSRRLCYKCGKPGHLRRNCKVLEKPVLSSIADIDSQYCSETAEGTGMPETTQERANESSESKLLCEIFHIPPAGICKQEFQTCHAPDGSLEKPVPNSGADMDSNFDSEVEEETSGSETTQSPASESKESGLPCKSRAEPHLGIIEPPRTCYKCGEPGHLKKDCKAPEESVKKHEKLTRRSKIAKERARNCKNCGKIEKGMCSMPKKCYKCGQVGHLRRQCPNQGQLNTSTSCEVESQSEDLVLTSPTSKASASKPVASKRVCFNCGQPGHLKKECPMLEHS